MGSTSATAIGQKIDDYTFQIVTILMTCIAILLVAVRLVVRRVKISKFCTDDFMLFFAAVAAIGAAITVNILLPFAQTQVDITAGLIASPPDLVHILGFNVKMQDACVALGFAAIFGVKFSFLFFFRLILEKTDRLLIYWRFVTIFTVPCAIFCACTFFMVCPAFGKDILAVCVYSGLARQKAVLYVTIVLDILSDVLLISIPVILLWDVRMSPRRKLGFLWLLCLSSFCIVCAIIRAVGHDLVNGQNDVVWILFWSHMEVCVALVACSMTVFRGLFNIKGTRRKGLKLRPFMVKIPEQTNNSWGSGPNDLRNTGNGNAPHIEMSNITNPEISGLRSFFFWDPFEDGEDGELEGNNNGDLEFRDIERGSPLLDVR